VVRNVRRFVAADHGRDVVFSVALRLKDVEYALRLARKLGFDAAYGEVAGRTLRRLAAAGHAGDNESRIVDVMRDALPPTSRS
jgi:3-hydroxyisobutyrate dehydrogenase